MTSLLKRNERRHRRIAQHHQIKRRLGESSNFFRYGTHRTDPGIIPSTARTKKTKRTTKARMVPAAEPSNQQNESQTRAEGSSESAEATRNSDAAHALLQLSQHPFQLPPLTYVFSSSLQIDAGGSPLPRLPQRSQAAAPVSDAAVESGLPQPEPIATSVVPQRLFPAGTDLGREMSYEEVVGYSPDEDLFSRYHRILQSQDRVGWGRD